MGGLSFGERARIAAVLIAALGLVAVPAFAQLSSASVTGVVRDTSGSVVPDVNLTLRNVDTAVERQALSNNAGNYVFLSITPGNYTLQAGASGFQTTQIPPFTLAVNQTATLDITLNVGAVQQTVTVEASGELVQSSTAEVGAVVAEKQVMDLPLNGRNFTQLLSLSPGVAPVSVSQNSGGFGNVASGTAFVFPAINGQTNRSNFFMTDGLNNQGAFSSTYAVPPIIDAIAEFKVNGHNDLAEFGGALGGIINVATKSGTNEFHGTLWEFLRNDAFNARNTFQNAVTPFRQNQFGASAGGPVIIPKLYNGRNKTFFFGAYEGFRFSQASNAFLHLPTDAEFNGNLSGQAQAFDPFSTRPDPNKAGGFIRDPFPGNQIPASRIDTRLVNFFKQVRPPLFNVGIGNFNAEDNTPFIQHQNEFTSRIDQTLGTKDFFWFRYSALYYDTSKSGGLPTVTNNITDNPGQNFGASWVHTFGPTLMLQAQYGRSHQETNSFTVYNSLNAGSTAGSLGFSPNFSGNFIGGFSLMPGIGISGYQGIPGSSKSLNPNETNVQQWKVNVSKTIGSHTLRWGGELNSSTFESLYNNASSTFAFQQTSDPSQPSVYPGNAMASFLLNVPDSAGRRNVHETTRWGGVMGFYFQDSWKATPKLTVNIGLRYDRTFIPPYGLPSTVGQNGGIEAGSIDFNSGNYVVQKVPPPCSERGHAPCIPGDGTLPAHVVVSPTGKIYHDTTTNWGPRLGLAYRVTNNMAVRAGFGIYYDNWAAVTQTSQNYEGTWPDIGQQLANNLNVPVPGAATPSVTGLNPFAAGGGLFPAPTPFNQVQWYMDPYAKNPYAMQWNFGVADQLNSSTTISVDYVGSGSRRLDVGGYYNVALTPGPGNPADRAPYPYIHPTYYDRSIGRGNYNSLQFQFNKRFSKGLAYQISYTYSKAIDMGSSGWYGVEGQSVEDPYHISRDRSVSGFDLTQVLSVNLVYELPFGKGKPFASNSRLLNYIVGGWQVNTITIARSGLPYNITVPGDLANTGNTGYLRANLVGNPSLSNPTAQEWFNTAAFAVPDKYTFGNLGRFPMRASTVWNIDSSVFRQFPIREGKLVEFRAESFNTPNTVIMGTPNGNVLDPNFGKIFGTTTGSRSLQLGLKVLF
ncbi:MAG TPA: carboxypeptidase-like regulatory domain-containing protein [Bryobacterales bacterium]|nr:carboxypeptidase-like regulatory domain-containing protein [Bryobacterales bacterium]